MLLKSATLAAAMRLGLAGSILGLLLSIATGARADASSLSPYEAESLRRAAASVGGAIDDAPEGKIVEGIDVVALEVIEDRDPAPRFLNALHTTTRAKTIRRESLLRVGDRFERERVDETVRELQTFQQISLVLAVALRGSSPDRVRVLYVTKDTWSLRTQADIRLGSGGLDLLTLEPIERNIAGTFDAVSGRFVLDPETITLGAGLYIPRFAGEHVYSSNIANVILSRDTGQPEGTTGGVAVFKPLVSADTPWVWQQQARWEDQYVRRYVDAKLTDFEGVPDKYHSRSFTESAGIVRSLGHDHKADVMLGAEANVRAYLGLDPNVYDARIVRDYAAARVPTSDTRVAPYVQLRLYENRFVRLHDVALLGLFEDYRVGYDVSIRAYPVTRTAGSTRDFLGGDAFAQYVLPISDGYARASANMLIEATTGDVPTAFYAANVAFVSPRFFAGRLVLDALALARPENYPNLRSVLGGDTRLRGYPSAAFLGENLVAYNAELRTRPIEILACELGGAAFFDVGDAFDGRDLRAKSSAGVGLRAMLPQLDRRTWRFDVAFPMVRAGGAGPVAFYLAFEQAFPSTIVTPPSAFPTQSFLNPVGGALGQ